MDNAKKDVSLTHRVSVAGEGASYGAYTALAHTVGMPVDIVNMGLKHIGVRTSENPIMGGNHINSILQSGLKYYYNTVVPALGGRVNTLEDKADKIIYDSSYVAGGLVGFTKFSRAAELMSSGTGKALAAGGLAQLIEAGAELVNPPAKPNEHLAPALQKDAAPPKPADGGPGLDKSKLHLAL